MNIFSFFLKYFKYSEITLKPGTKEAQKLII